jgi:hypothetical protein
VIGDLQAIGEAAIVRLAAAGILKLSIAQS